MKKKLLILITLVALSVPLLGVVQVGAIDVIDPICLDANGDELQGDRRPAICDDNKAIGTQTENPLFGDNGILTTVANILSLVVGIAAVLSIIISAVRLIMSGGEPNAISGARRGILFAVIGLVIAATAQLLVRFVLSKLPS